MNIFGLVLFLIIIYWFTKYKLDIAYKYLVALTIGVSLSTNFGYFIKISNITIDYSRGLMYILGIVSFVLLIKKRIVKRKAFILICLFQLSVWIGLILCYTLKYTITQRENGGWDAYLFGVNNMADPIFSTTNIKMLLDVFFVCIIWIYTKRNCNKEWWKDVFHEIAYYIKYIILYGVFEAIIVYVLGLKTLSQSLLSFFMGKSGSTYMEAISRGNGYQLQGMFKEPAQYARSLVFIVLILFFDNIVEQNKKNIKWIFVSMILMLISMSFTSMLLVIFLLSLYTLYKCKTNPKLIPIFIQVAFVIGGVVIAILFYFIKIESYYGQRLYNAIKIIIQLFNTSDFTSLYSRLSPYMSDGSSILRIGSSYANLALQLKNNYFFGIGVGNSVSFSYTSNLVTDLGICGLVLYFRLFIYERGANLFYYIAVVLLFIVGLFTNVISLYGIDMMSFFILLRYGFDGSNQHINLIERKR